MATQIADIEEKRFIETPDGLTVRAWWLERDHQDWLHQRETTLTEAGHPEDVIKGVLEYVVHWWKSFGMSRIPNPVPEFAEGLVDFGEENDDKDSLHNRYWTPRADQWRREGRSEEWIQEQIEANPNAAVDAENARSLRDQEWNIRVGLVALLWAALATVWAVYAQFFASS